MSNDDRNRRTRWRLVLGSDAEESLGELPAGMQGADQALAFLYDREYGKGRNTRTDGSRSGSLDPSQLTVPDWINKVHELFPKKTVERLEKDALERYEIKEVVTNPEVLQRAQPNTTLLKAVLQTKHLMNQEVLKMARLLVRRVVEDLVNKLAREVRQPFVGSVSRRRSMHKVAKNFDVKRTVRENLKNFDPQRRQLVIRTPYFFSRQKRQLDRWQVIILVDQSGSMVDSVIHSAVTASIFHQLPGVKCHLVAFDTSVVDLTSDVSDPVETLMKVQLGGGTDIGRSLEYALTLIENPRRTIVVLITDFYEGAPIHVFYDAARRILEGGSSLLGLAALSADATSNYDRTVAQSLANMGAHIGAMTPGELANWVAEKIG